MKGNGTLRRGGGVVACALIGLLALGQGGCGSDGESQVIPRGACLVDPGEPIPVGCLDELIGEFTGIVYAPNGVYAAADPWWWPGSWSLVSQAVAAFFNVEPVGIGVEVGLSEVTPLDAADGEIDNPIPVFQWAETNADGVYEIAVDASEQIERCRLMLHVGNRFNGDLTRALAYSKQVNVDPASEAVVRLILARIHQTDLQLCDFSEEGLRVIVQEAEKAASVADGNTVQEVNDDAYFRVSRDCEVLEMVEAVTQVSFDPPIQRNDRGECIVDLSAPAN